MKIIANLTGGLGNQLFIAAATIAYAQRYGFQPVISSFFSYQNSSSCVGRQQSAIITQACQPFLMSPEDIKQLVLDDYQEPTWLYQPLPLFSKNTRLNGYYQSPQYFNDCEQQIRRLFYPSPSQLDLIPGYEAFKKYRHYRKVAVHIRRTDYVALNYFHHNLPLSYYQHAMRYHQIKHDNSLFVFFSDDKAYAKQHFGTIVPSLFMDDTDDHEFQLMTQCDDFIIANSTFSWWAAWLSQSIDKTIIAPKTWFVSGILDWSTIYCDDWIIMSDDGVC